ncbi:MAG: sulfatase [Verrucomicrobia bacterium]|nr:sulfatase [Verrucomicrobiota bacterium]
MRASIVRVALGICLLNLCAVAMPGLAKEAQPSRPNVLFVAADDLNMRLACYGQSFMKTPNLDRLAGRGVRFERAYCQFPLCNPSRSSLLTGRRPDTTKVLDSKTMFREALPKVVTLPQHFQDNGYWTARCGKIYHNAPGLPENAGWDMGQDNPPVTDEDRAKVRMTAQGSIIRGEIFPPSLGGFYRKLTTLEKQGRTLPPGEPLTWGMIEGPEESLEDGRIALKAIEFFRQRPAGKPFFLAVGFMKPHVPFFAPSRYFDLYPLDSISLPQVPRDDRDDLPLGAPYSAKREKAWNGHIPDELWRLGVSDQQAREIIRGYYACVSYVDAQVGKLVAALEQAKLLDNTIVVLWGDNGYHLTEHGLWAKNTLFEESCQVPLLVVAPGRKARGVGSSRLVEFVDIYPTLAELCGLPAPEGVEGASFAPLLDDPNRPWKKAAFTQLRNIGYTVRTERWRYTEWGSSERAELYDHQSDPGEIRNLAGQREHTQTASELHDLLKKGWRAALP